MKPSDLDAALAAAYQANGELMAASNALREDRTERAQEAIADAQAKLSRVIRNLERLGAQIPPERAAISSTGAALDRLTQMTSPANKRLLAALENAYLAAREVDKERGEVGDGIAELIGDLVTLRHQEIHGPASGRGRE